MHTSAQGDYFDALHSNRRRCGSIVSSPVDPATSVSQHLVAIAAAGALHSGNYLVWSVRHTITSEAHKMAFRLVRNAVGTTPSGGPLPGAVSLA